MDRRSFIAAGLGLPLATMAGRACAESGPLTKIIFPFAAGGSGDTLCRLVAKEIGQPLDRTVIVEDRNGADGLIGIRYVKNAKPDGTTILVTTGPTMYLLPMVETHPSFNTDKDFMPVSLLARFDFCVVAGPAVDAKDFKGFVAWLKAHPDQATFGVPSNGTIPHFAGTKLSQVLGIPLTRVAYRGTTPILNDLIGGHLPFAITPVSDVVAHKESGTLKVFAVSSVKRSPYLPDVPTLKDEGIDLVADAWYGMWLPAGSPPDFAKQLANAVHTALAKPDVQQKLKAAGLIAVGSTTDELVQELKTDIARWGPVVKATGYKITN
jgi:tripartite-type tricarboxylate transporter receptor subunit TctC